MPVFIFLTYVQYEQQEEQNL